MTKIQDEDDIYTHVSSICLTHYVYTYVYDVCIGAWGIYIRTYMYMYVYTRARYLLVQRACFWALTRESKGCC